MLLTRGQCERFRSDTILAKYCSVVYSLTEMVAETSIIQAGRAIECSRKKAAASGCALELARRTSQPEAASKGTRSCMAEYLSAFYASFSSLSQPAIGVVAAVN